LYFEFLSDAKIEDFEKAVSQAIQSSKYFPTIAELKEYMPTRFVYAGPTQEVIDRQQQ
jgi:hypothetical protein